MQPLQCPVSWGPAHSETKMCLRPLLWRQKSRQSALQLPVCSVSCHAAGVAQLPIIKACIEC